MYCYLAMSATIIIDETRIIFTFSEVAGVSSVHVTDQKVSWKDFENALAIEHKAEIEEEDCNVMTDLLYALTGYECSGESDFQLIRHIVKRIFAGKRFPHTIEFNDSLTELKCGALRLQLCEGDCGDSEEYEEFFSRLE